jgi:hypothetical protein
MPPQSTQFRGDSYCGLYCGACEILNLYRTAQEQGTEARWDDLPEELKNVLPPSYTIACTGCKTDLLSPGCQACPVRICASGKVIEACVLCAEFPCELIRARQARNAEVLEAILPHLKAEFRGVDRMREIGYAGWCQEQAAHWLCPQCGTPFTWYQKMCGKCGRSLMCVREYD